MQRMPHLSTDRVLLNIHEVLSMIRVLAILLSILAFDAHAASLSPADSVEVQYLISSVESLQHAHFVRNGTSYDAPAAAAHLRLKLQNSGSRVRTTDDFIRLCASGSSVSGQPYQIRFDDGRTVTSESFLRAKLEEFRAGSRQPE
jgi:hypothetical protein